MVIVFGLWSVSWPPLAVPPSSRTWKVKLLYGLAAAASATGTKRSRFAVISANVICCDAVTSTHASLPFLYCSFPAVGSVAMMTDRRSLPSPSEKPKSPSVSSTDSRWCASIVLSAPLGASFTLLTFTVIVFSDTDVSTPLLAVPPLSCTLNPIDAYELPFAFAAGANTRLPRLPTGIDWFSVTLVPDSFSVPFVGSVVMITADSVLAGLSFVSVNPKSPDENV